MKALRNEELYNEIKKVWQDDHMADYIYTFDVYIEHKGNYIEVGSTTPTIQKQFWFDDEREIPQVNKTHYVAVNMRHNAPQLKELYSKGRELYLMNNYNRGSSKLKAVAYLQDDEYVDTRTLVDEVLLQLINAEIEVLREKYAKRLESYWKRYSDKIRFSGYWVNR